MTETVKSKFNAAFWISIVLYAALMITLSLICLYMFNNPGHRDRPDAILLLVILVGLGCFYSYRATTTFIRVNVAPEGLMLNYLATQTWVTIPYAGIKHVSRVGTGTGSGSKLILELNSGKKISFREEYYTNFDEFAEAIRKQRFNLE